MRVIATLVVAPALAAGCATLPTTVHNTTAPGFAGEIGPLYAPEAEDEAKDVTSADKERVKTKDGAGVVSLLQYGPFYTKVDAAPLPGLWLGLGMVDPTPGRLGWYPAVEFTGSFNRGDGGNDETRDGFLVDTGGNRYLYEVKRQSSGFGIALPQIVEAYPVKRFGVYFGAIPTFMHDSTTTTVDIVYENDRRLVKADPDLDAKFRDIQTYEQRNDDSTNRWLLPMTLGARWQVGPFHLRVAYTTRRVDSVKDYSNAFKDVALLTVGYVSGNRARSGGYTPRQAPPPQPAGGSTTTTTTTTGPNGTTTTTTTTTGPNVPGAPLTPRR